MSLTKADILGAPRRVLKVPTPEWSRDGTDDACVYVRSLSGNQRADLQKRDDEMDVVYVGRIAAILICDEEGEPLFKPDEVPALLEGPEFTPIERAIDMGLTFNANVNEAKETLAGNSEAILSESTGSD